MRIFDGVTVVVPALVTEKSTLVSCINAIRSNLVREIIVVDDGSEVEIESWLYDHIDFSYPKVYVHTNNINLGPSVSRNFGAQIATSKIILFLDVDVVLTEQCVDKLYDKIIDSELMISQPMPDNPESGTEFERVSHNDLLTQPYSNLSESGEIDYLYSFCFMMHRTTFFNCRGFSTFFTITHEDVEFGIRLKNMGCKMFIVQDARVDHHHPFTPDEYFGRCTKNGDSFARLADVTGIKAYHKYVDLITSHKFSASIEDLEQRYLASRSKNEYVEEVYDEISKYYWIQGIRNYYLNPVVSVAVPVSGGVKRLNRTLRSIKRQNFKNFEVILVYTNEVDVTKIEWTGSQSFKLIQQTEGKLARAMNMAKSEASGEFFTWVQCGDYIGENYLRLLVNEFLLDSSTALSFCGYKFFGLSEETDGWYVRENDEACQHDLIECFARWNIVGPGFMVRSNSGIQYNESNWLAEDWDFFLQNSLKGRIRFVNEVLYHYLDHDDSLSREVGWRASDTSLLDSDNELALQHFHQAAKSQSICGGYIVRNEAIFIRESLLSVINHFDEIVIIDTGSTDQTLSIIEDIVNTHPRGKKISLYHRAIYNYNVSRYRNEIADLTDCDWIVIVDGDEVWRVEQIESFCSELRSPKNYQIETVDVFQKRWASMLEQQTSYTYIGSIIRAYRRSFKFIWRQSETIDFFVGEKRYESRYVIDPGRKEAISLVSEWLSQCNSEIELQSVEYAYRNFDGQLSDYKKEIPVFFDHFSRCKGDYYLKDRAKRIHGKMLGSTQYLEYDKSYNYNHERFIPFKQHHCVRYGLSIIIPHYNNKTGLAKCVESISRYEPDVDFEIVIVCDNPGYVVELPDFENLTARIRLVHHHERGGFSVSVNDGIRAARYEFICVLNDDVAFVSEGWASRILGEMEIDPKIAVAGPITNSTGGYPPVQYEEFSGSGYEEVPKIVKNIKDRTAVDIPKYTALAGFCYFIRRSVFAETGLFDSKNYPWIYGEDNAFTFNVLKAGYRAILINSVFVWHGLSETAGEGRSNPVIDLDKTKKQNVQTVINLGLPKLIAYARAKNEEKIIEEQLSRMLGFCDEVVIHDTGSSDDTVKIARGFERVTVVETRDTALYNASLQLNIALQVARSKNPDWVLYFDVDQFYDNQITDEIDHLLNDNEVDIWSFRLYDGRFCIEEDDSQYDLNFIYHTRKLCEPCYRVLPSLYRNKPELIVAEPVNWNNWSNGEPMDGATLPPEHCVLPIQYIDPDWRGHFYDRRTAHTIIRHLGSCISWSDLEEKKQLYQGSKFLELYADDWRNFPLTLPRKKLMKWHESPGTEVDLGSNVVKYIYWDWDPEKRKKFVW